MNHRKRRIFRPDAVRRYIQEKEKAVLPRFIKPKTFVYLWILFGILVVTGFVVWFAKIPVYVSGSSIVVDEIDEFRCVHDDFLIVAFLPGESLSHLQIGQSMFVNTGSERLTRTVIGVEPEIISPNDAKRRFCSSTTSAAAVTQPVAIVIARLGSMSTCFPASTYCGSVFGVDIEVGTRRVISLFPIIGQFFRE